jgi:hypothetical protein
MLSVRADKNMGSSGTLALDKRARHLYGANCFGVSTHPGSSGMPAEAVIHLADGQSPTQAETVLADLAKPTCSFVLLDITTDVGSEVVADAYSVVADPDEITMIKMVLAIDDVSGALEILAYERVGAAIYGDTPAGKTEVANLKEFSCGAAAATVAEVNDWT